MAQPGFFFDAAPEVGDFLEILEKPRIDGGDLVNPFNTPTLVQGVAKIPEASGMGGADLDGEKIFGDKRGAGT